MSTHGEPRRHQVTELPPMEAHITEYRCQSAVCPDCGKATQAELPQEAQGHFGPELTALIAYMTVVCRMPRRVCAGVARDRFWEYRFSLGSIQNSLGRSQRSGLPNPARNWRKQLAHEPVINSDETGYQNRRRQSGGSGRWSPPALSSIRLL